ncbi:type 1 fimbria pilin [Pseudomonas sp. AG1028]|uniref:fimbrial protein n=1 Tax=Pseudomonas sp. AG1028 TaxID=2572911 RepID=UPI0011ADA0C5|nr:fimbrial protein [Pseudomonas sp. AG1028]TWE02851.1 type 1 fimbria pilin [Pseudomonas sp. AG1028]
MRALFWMLLAVSGSVLAQAADTTQVQVNGKLVTPPCRPGFATSMNVKLEEVSVRQLLDGDARVTEVPLTFDCRPDSRVSLVLSAGLGSIDTQTLRTSRENLGLRLMGVDGKPGISLGQTSSWTVGNDPLQLTLRVRPVSLGELPEAGAFSATLLMQILYL